MAVKNIMIVGVGGQGTLLTSRILGGLTIAGGYDVKLSEVHGMAQRGGSVVSHVRAGREVHSPLIPAKSADVILAFEPGEAVRCLPYLKENGLVITNSRIVKPVTSSLSGGNYSGQDMIRYLQERTDNLLVVDGEEICRRAGSPKVLNVALLGAAAKSGALGITVEEMLNAVRKNVKEKYIALNETALELGGEQI